MEILIADSLPESCMEELRQLGSDVAYEPDLSADDLPARISQTSILIVRSTRVLPEAIRQARQLQMILRAGAGFNTIAVKEASEQGIFVTNCPGKSATAVAELTFGLILALDRRIVDNTVSLREGVWNKAEYGKARGLAGRTLGVVGMGKVGRLVVRRAQAFEMNTVAWSRSLTPEAAEGLGVEFCAWPREVARKSDIVTIHCAATPQTMHLVNEEFLNNMRDGAYLIHTSRGAMVDERALARAVDERGLRVGLDVYENEPAGGTGHFRNALLERPNVIGTHHIGASTQQASTAIAQEVVRIVKSFLITGEVLNAVNICETSPATWQLIVRHNNRVGVMASILEAIKSDKINAEEISNRIFVGSNAACCTIMLSDRPSDEAMASIRGSEDIIQADLRAVV